MRGAFIKTLAELAAIDPRIVFLTADLGYLAVEPFSDKFPDRFINVGVAEQNMVGLATGLAEAGFVPFVYSIVPFAVLRPYEFIRNGPVNHRLPVRIVGVGGGMEYSTNGLTHYGLEDLAVMRTLPGMTVVAPADAQQTRTVLNATWNLPGPVYYRLGKDDRSTVPGLEGRFSAGRIEVVREGKDVLLLATGAIATEAVKAADSLQAQGTSATVAVLVMLNPAPTEALKMLLESFRTVLSVEAHFQTGGLGSLVAETIAEASLTCRLVRCGVNTLPDGYTGSQAYVQDRYGLSSTAIARAASAALGRPLS